MTDEVQLRPAVQWFAEQMELKLREDDHEDSWDDVTFDCLFKRLFEEFEELNRTFRFFQVTTFVGTDSPTYACKMKEHANHVVQEAVDVANFAMFIADRIRRF